MKLVELLDKFTDAIAINLYFEDSTCTGIYDSDRYIIRVNGDLEIAWLELDNAKHNKPLLNVGLYGNSEI